jgi:DNA-binding PadR family transcriptional regulator
MEGLTVPTPKKRRLGSRYAVLGMLSMGLKTGYAMKKHVEGNLGHFWSESYGQIYPVLRQLVADGLATCKEERRPGKPRRNLYTLTRAGWKELRAWLALRHGRGIREAELAWCGETLEHLRRIAAERGSEASP